MFLYVFWTIELYISKQPEILFKKYKECSDDKRKLLKNAH